MRIDLDDYLTSMKLFKKDLFGNLGRIDNINRNPSNLVNEKDLGEYLDGQNNFLFLGKS